MATALAAWFIAFVAGFGSMVLELTAVRLMAPHFGTSVYVWTNVIGVTLLALALGAWIGGYLADRGRGLPFLSTLLAGAGLFSCAIPLVIGPLAGFLLPGELNLDEAFRILVEGSLLTTSLLFGPPVMIVGMTSPILVRHLVESGVPVGRVSGGIWAISTLGSLLGTFGSTHWFVPFLGARSTVILAGVTLLLAAAVAMGPLRASARSAALLAVAVIAGATSLALTADLPRSRTARGVEILAERESPYQFVRVVAWERDIDPGPGVSLLRGKSLLVNESHDSFQSLVVEGSIFTGAYYDPLALCSLLCSPSDSKLDVLVIGLGGGAVVPILDALVESQGWSISITGIEIDPVVTELAREHMGLDPDRVEIFSDVDGRFALAELEREWDLVLLDAYADQVHIPAHLASREMFALVRSKLAEGGIVAANVGRLDAKDPVLAAMAATAADAFERAWTWPVLGSRNAILVASRGESLDWDRLRRRVDLILASPPPRAEADFLVRLEELRDHAGFPGVLEPHVREGGGPILRDDTTLIDILQMRALDRSRR